MQGYWVVEYHMSSQAGEETDVTQDWFVYQTSLYVHDTRLWWYTLVNLVNYKVQSSSIITKDACVGINEVPQVENFY